MAGASPVSLLGGALSSRSRMESSLNSGILGTVFRGQTNLCDPDDPSSVERIPFWVWVSSGRFFFWVQVASWILGYLGPQANRLNPCSMLHFLAPLGRDPAPFRPNGGLSYKLFLPNGGLWPIFPCIRTLSPLGRDLSPSDTLPPSWGRASGPASRLARHTWVRVSRGLFIPLARIWIIISAFWASAFSCDDPLLYNGCLLHLGTPPLLPSFSLTPYDTCFCLAILSYLKAPCSLYLDCTINLQLFLLHRTFFPSFFPRLWFYAMDFELLSAMDNLNFTAEEAEEVISDSPPGDENSSSWLVGSVMTLKPINGDSVIRVFRLVWKPKNIQEMVELRSNFFLIKPLIVDARSMIFKRRPWAYHEQFFSIKPYNPILTVEDYDFKLMTI
ncbi:hypothetical protein GQ457_17G007730 [Hibiscus cannabinus]